MRILALDTSSKSCSAALYDSTLLGEITLDLGLTHSEKLMPMVDALFTLTGAEKSSVDAIAVAAGPGSFTGLRIGMATAQGLSLALGVPIAPVPTLYALKEGGAGKAKLTCPMMDARRGEVYAAVYRGDEAVLAPGPYPLKEVLRSIGDESVYVLGDGAYVHKEAILEALPNAVIAPKESGMLKAGYIAAAALKQNLFVSDAQARIDYMRQSQAERLRNGR
ncbi:MAG: tRNA (adenosine(37)-N6)-threonylcarbamoyltransferase complex dimerization subunit type 1 TsaB [Clostridiales bacterium]|nr:tRNA (adenosine(37)-N6)-threonylcarbamoyltransferase complex dimerization subunit type 1 TsaB [Clostridiales bacterium]